MQGKGMKGAKNKDRSASFSPAVCAPFTIDPAGHQNCSIWIHSALFFNMV